jgi:hypothetical protein
MASIVFMQEEWLFFVVIAVLATFGAGQVWLRRRRRLISFYGRAAGFIHGQFRGFCYVMVLTSISLGLGLLVCKPYLKKKVPLDLLAPLHIVLTVDISKSMLAAATATPAPPTAKGTALPSCSPTRLGMAVQEVTSFIHLLEQHQLDKIALVVFARYAYPAIPVLTDDYHLFTRRFEKEMLLENVLTMVEGTNHWFAVERALAVFPDDSSHRKLLIIVTDGDPDAPPQVLAESKAAAREGLQRSEDLGVYVVGIGDPGVRQPVPRRWRADGCPDFGSGYIMQSGGPDAGRIMTTLTDPAALRTLAEELGGQYIHSATGSDLAEQLAEIVAQERRKIGVRYAISYIDLSEFLIMGMLALLAVLVILKTP